MSLTANNRLEQALNKEMKVAGLFKAICFISNNISFPTATLNICFTSPQPLCFCSLKKVIHLFAPPPPAVSGCQFYIILSVIHLLCFGAINLILFLCSPALPLDMVFLLQSANVLGQNLKHA